MPDPILFNLHVKPRASDAYLWCDYAELRCLSHVDHKFSRGSLLELLEESADIDADEADVEIVDDEEELFEEDEAALDANEAPGEDVLPAQDKHESKVADVYRNLAFRAALFGHSYPFVLDDASQELTLRDIDTPARELYLQLLLSSSLRLVPPTRRHELTEPFEEISTRIFSCLMPSGWEVHRFGAKGATRYSGHLHARLTKLAEDVRGVLLTKKDDYHATNSGDGGLDIVAWHPLGDDKRIGIPIALAQCGCTAEEWSLKTLEASPAGPLAGALTTHHPWATYYFMPQDLMAASGDTQEWQCRPKLTKTIVIDRYRLIKLAEQYGVAEECVSASDQVLEATALAVE